jgi:hypothetical protein
LNVVLDMCPLLVRAGTCRPGGTPHLLMECWHPTDRRRLGLSTPPSRSPAGAHTFVVGKVSGAEFCRSRGPHAPSQSSIHRSPTRPTWAFEAGDGRFRAPVRCGNSRSLLSSQGTAACFLLTTPKGRFRPRLPGLSPGESPHFRPQFPAARPTPPQVVSHLEGGPPITRRWCTRCPDAGVKVIRSTPGGLAVAPTLADLRRLVQVRLSASSEAASATLASPGLPLRSEPYQVRASGSSSPFGFVPALPDPYELGFLR